MSARQVVPDTIGQGNLKGHLLARTLSPKLVLQRGHIKPDITTTSGRYEADIMKHGSIDIE